MYNMEGKLFTIRVVLKEFINKYLTASISDTVTPATASPTAVVVRLEDVE